MIPEITDKNVLFITTKNLDYIRNTQEINILKKYASSCKITGSLSKHYFFRLINVFFSLLAITPAQFDTVFIGFAPQLVLPLFRRKFKRNYIIIDFFISLYDTFCLDRKVFPKTSMAGRFLHYLDRVTLSCANLIICDTVAHGKFFVKEFQASPNSLFPLYLQADQTIYHPVPQHKPLRLRDKYIILYFGSVLPLQGIDVVLNAMSLLKDNKNLFFYFIGPVRRKELKTICPHSNNILYIDYLPQKQLAKYIGWADLCLAGHFNKNNEKAGRTIPGKAFIYKAMNKPMILGDNPANHELFQTDENTTFVEMGTPQALATAILDLYEKHARNLVHI